MINNIEELKVLKTQKVIDALSILNSGGMQIALVINESDQLIGTISDGDIRRALLNNKSLNSSVLDIMNSKFLYIKDNEPRKNAVEIMKRNLITKR